MKMERVSDALAEANRRRRRGKEGESDGRGRDVYNLLFPFSGPRPALQRPAVPSFRMLMAGLVSLNDRSLPRTELHRRAAQAAAGASSVREDTPEGINGRSAPLRWEASLDPLGDAGWERCSSDLTNRLVVAALIITLGFGAIGFADAGSSSSKRNSKGLAGRKKLLWQTMVFVWWCGLLRSTGKHGSLYLDTRSPSLS